MRRIIISSLLLLSLTTQHILGIDNTFSHFTIKEGLSQSTIKAICQDYRGYIWIGSADGLNRYDAYQFFIYRNKPHDFSTLCGNDISVIYENPSDSTLWVGTDSDGLNQYIRSTDTFAQHRKDDKKENPLPSNQIKAITADGNGKLWIATRNAGLCRFEPLDTAFYVPLFAKDERLQSINAITFDTNGNLWIGTPHGLFRITASANGIADNANIDFINTGTHKNSTVTSLQFDRRGALWIGTNDDGPIRYQPENQATTIFPTQTGFPPNASIHCLTERRNGEIWIGTSLGLYQFMQLEGRFISYVNDPLDNESLNDDIIYSMMEDNAGILWLGSYFGGVNKLDPDESRFNKFSNTHKLFGLSKAANNTKSLFQDDKRVLWVGTSKGLVAFDNLMGRQHNRSQARIFFKDVSQHSVFGDSYGNLYVSNDHGIFTKDINSADFKSFKPHKASTETLFNSFRQALQDSDGTVWFLTPQGLLRYSPTSNSISTVHPIGEFLMIQGDYFIAATESQNGTLWLGTLQGKLYQYNKNSNQILEVKPEGMTDATKPYNRIFSICEQTPGIIWIGTNNGLYRLDENKNSIRGYMDTDGLSNNVVYSVLTDKRNRIWCSTNLGVSVLNTDKQSFINYSWEDGLQSNEFNQNAYFKNRDGMIFLGGIDGFNIIEPERITPNTFIPPVVITALSIDHMLVTPFSHPSVTRLQTDQTKQITLPHNKTIFTFEFAALNYIHSSKNQYRYQLEGYDADWVNASTNRKATYTNINPGEYTFMVQGSNNNGIWNEVAATIKITILPPFWLTWWFKVLFFIALGIAAYTIFYIRVKTVKRKALILKHLVLAKTADLSSKNQQIEEQNRNLKRVNEEIRLRNEHIRETNEELNLSNEQIALQRDNLISLSNELKEANQSRINFFTQISHEFRTPLTLIIGPLKELLNSIDQTPQAEIIRKFRIVYGNASKLLLLVNQLLDFRKAETDNISLNRSKQDIVFFVQKTALLFNEIARTKKIEFQFKSSVSKLEIFFDEEKLEKVISNLLSNAFKFTPAGGTITVATSQCENDGDRLVQISITDSGSGIIPDELTTIFEPFYQSRLHQNDEPGSGIGLAIVKKFTLLHGGTIDVESTPGMGSTFTVTLPALEHYDGPTKKPIKGEKPLFTHNELIMTSLDIYAPLMLKESGTKHDFHLPKILIVEDDNDLRAYLREILSPNYQIFESPLASKAEQLIEKTAPELVLSDVMMPGMSGIELCDRIKNNPATSHTPVILLTALTDMQSQTAAMKAGADGYIQKPFDPQHLSASIENVIMQRRRLKEKFLRGMSTDTAQYTSNHADQAFLDKVIEEIEKNMADSAFDVEMLCQNIHLSQPQTYRKIKALTNLSISEFIRNIRLKKASTILATTNQTISEVAYEVGFNDPNYFTKCFVKLFGQTPSDFVRLKSM